MQSEQNLVSEERKILNDQVNALKAKVTELEKEKKTLRYEMDKEATLSEEKFRFLTEQK